MATVRTYEAGTRRSWLVPARRTDLEIMDGDDFGEEEMASALAEIRSVNRWLGGLKGVIEPLSERARRGGWGALSVLDVGTGSADIPRALDSGALGDDIAVRAAGLDLNPIVTRIARREVGPGGRVPILQGDGMRLPFGDGAFDVVTASLFLHHFKRPDAARLVGEFARVARRLVVVNDLQRHRVPWFLIWLLATVLRRSRMFRNDAPLSVLRGFTPGELLSIGRDAGLPESRLSVQERAAWRVVLVVECEGCGAA